MDPAFRTTAKGHTEVDIAVEAHALGSGVVAAAGAAAGGGGAQLVWRCVTTAVILSPRKTKREQPAAAEQGRVRRSVDD